MIITRFHNTEKLDATVEFLTPTFLGGADQNAELRSAPFKNLIRQWWRVVNGNLEEGELRQREGELFGTVLGDEKATVSKVRLTLTSADGGLKLTNAPFNIGRTTHPEVKGGMAIDNATYLGYGPVQFGKPSPVFKQYIAHGGKSNLSIHFPRQFREQLVSTMQLIDAFGTIGSRCRNGLGSLSLSMDGVAKLNPATVQSRRLTELVGSNLKAYPNSFGRDNEGLLIWESNGQSNWESALKLLAGTYLNTRTDINISGNPNELHERHVLGFPVTNHDKLKAPEWEKNGRMPSQLRLMVKRNPNNDLIARILHLPHQLPKPWPQNLPTQLEIWQKVHRFLDNQKGQFHRIGGPT